MDILYFGNQLQKHGFTPTGVDYLGDALSEDFNVIRYSDKKRMSSRILDMTLGLIKHRKNAKMVLIDFYSTRAFWYAYLLGVLCRRFKLPYILIARGGNMAQRLKSSPKLSNKLWNNAAIGISPSAYLATILGEHGLTAFTIDNHIFIDNYKFKIREKVEGKLLYARAVHKKYNPTMAVEAIAKLKEKGLYLTLDFIGNEKDDAGEKCRDLARQLGVEDQLKFWGRLGKNEWANLSQNYDLFINPTNVDNTPISVIEAMALGLPVVSTNVGGIPFLLEHNKTALLVEAQDVDLFAEAINKLIDNPDQVKNLSRNGRNKVEQLDWSTVREIWKKTIKEHALQ